MTTFLATTSARRLLPLLQQRHMTLGLPSDVRHLGQNATAEAWALNTRLFLAVRPAVEALRQAGVEVCALKGLALLGDVYSEHWLRPLGDLDLLVRPGAAQRAARILESMGWLPARGDTRPLPGGTALALHRRDGLSIDLHWWPARNLPHRSHQDPWCWTDATPVEASHPLAESGLLRPSFEDHVVILAAHLWRADNTTVVHPVVDAHRLLTTHRTDLDAPALDRTAADQAATARVRSMLEVLHTTLGTVVPDDLRALPCPPDHLARREGRLVAADRRSTNAGSGTISGLRRPVDMVMSRVDGTDWRAVAQVATCIAATWMNRQRTSWVSRR